MSKRSRLNKRLEKQSQKTLIVSVAGIIIIIAILIRFGIPFIADLGFLSSKISIKSSKNTSANNSNSVYLSPPSLDPSENATNSAKIKITGNSVTGKQIAIFLNGSEIKKVNIEQDGSFSYDCTLTEGENIIKAKTVEGNKESDFSQSLTILYKTSSPSISIDSPSDGQTLKISPILISGKTDPNTKVTINDFWAVTDSNGNYTYNLTLQNGGNEIKAVALDSAGNKSEKTIHVTYSP